MGYLPPHFTTFLLSAALFSIGEVVDIITCYVTDNTLPHANIICKSRIVSQILFDRLFFPQT